MNEVEPGLIAILILAPMMLAMVVQCFIAHKYTEYYESLNHVSTCRPSGQGYAYGFDLHGAGYTEPLRAQGVVLTGSLELCTSRPLATQGCCGIDRVGCGIGPERIAELKRNPG